MSGKGGQEKAWEAIQQKTFTKWINSHLRKRKLAIENLQNDFSDGVQLNKFLEIISQENLPKYDPKPRIRIQCIQNVTTGLDFIKKKGVKLVNIQSEDIVDHNLKLILGLVWTIIQKFQIDDISEEELSAKEALLLWCKKKTAGYKDVAVKDFTYSWQDGLALCALIHRHRPDLIDFDSLDKENKAGNLQLAFDVAENSLGIAKLLDVEDMVDIKPDERSVITYLSQFYHVFASSQKGEVAGRRIGKLVDLTNQNDALKNDYSTRAAALVDWINVTQPSLEDRTVPNTLEGVKESLNQFNSYKDDIKPPKAVDKKDIEALFNNIAIKLRNNNRPAFVPAEGLSPVDIDELWTKLQNAEDEREKFLRAELARQEKLAQLLRRFNLKADALEAWNSGKQAYLAVNEHVDSLNVAHSKLKDLDAFDAEYKASDNRVASLQDLKDQILALNPPYAHEVESRANNISETAKALGPAASDKRNDLNDKLAKEQRKEELRLEFAKQSKEYNLWVKETDNAVEDLNFGLTLEEVRAYEGPLSESEQQATSTSESKKASLDHLWDEMTALGVTENRYTPITNKDIEARHVDLLKDLATRRAAFQAELERQEHNDNKRKEFAGKADEFIRSLADRRSSLESLTGEPPALTEAIRSHYQDGRPERDRLAPLSELQQELASLGIRDNKYTTYTLPILTSEAGKLGNYVRNYTAQLDEELELKERYVARANALVEWARATIPELQVLNFDNTLAGAQAKSLDWTKYQTTSKATQDIDKINLAVLFNKINDLLAKNGRPTYVPPAGLDLGSIDHVWKELNAAESERESAIRSELNRQENLAALFKRFSAEAADLEAWTNEKHSYLHQEEVVNDLDTARLKVKFLEVFSNEFAGKSLESLSSLRTQIVGGNYIDSDGVNARFGQLEAIFASFQQLEASKKAHLESCLATEQKKEDLSAHFADLSTDFAKYVRVTSEFISHYNFGFNLHEVQAYQSHLDESNHTINSEADRLVNALLGLFSDLHSSGVTPSNNRHTKDSDATIHERRQQLESALANRNQAYADELVRQQNNDAKRLEFASKASEFVKWLEERKAELASLTGGPDERIANVATIHQEGAPGAALISSLASSDEELKSLGVYDNPHTPYTLPVLTTRNNQFDTSVKNFLSDLNDEKEIEARARAQQAEYEHRTKLENLRLEFGKHAQSLNFFLESASEILTDSLHAESVEHAQALVKSLSEIEHQQHQQQETYSQLLTLSDQLSSEGVQVPVAEFTSRWENYLREASARHAALQQELARQESNETLRKDFASEANAFHSFIDQQTALVNASAEGELEHQLNALLALKPTIIGGKSKLDHLESLSHRLVEAGITQNKHTSYTFSFLKAAFEHLTKLVADKEALLQKEIIQKKGQSLSPDQLQEFKDVFEHFAKSNGYLSKLDFKACLQSLGEDTPDAEIDRLVAELSTDGKIFFEAFVGHMTSRAADTDTHAQILEAFTIVAGEKDFVTQADLLTVLPKDKVDYLIKVMPPYQGATDGSYDYKAWASSAFAR